MVVAVTTEGAETAAVAVTVMTSGVEPTPPGRVIVKTVRDSAEDAVTDEGVAAGDP